MPSYTQATVDDMSAVAPSYSQLSLDDRTWLVLNFAIVKATLVSGVSGTFTTVDGKTVTVKRGIITGIV